jgi:DNA polymerase III sliding clamp (beta) subunit (PCNA family)
MRSISQMARASGLTVSALRFYDRAGILVPAFVDPETGYRWYGPDQVQPARLVAGLRRVGMPLAEIALVLGQRSDLVAVRRLLDTHLRRLEDGLADARRELSRVHALLDHEENPMTVPRTTTRVSLAGAELAAALDSVRFAVGTDPELPVLGGVLLEVEEAALRLVATDRYRLAVSEARVGNVVGPRVSTVAPAELLDRARALLESGGEVTLTVDGAGISVQAQGRQVSGQSLDHQFPDYRRLLRSGGTHQVAVDVASLQEALAAGPTRSIVREQDGVVCDVAVLSIDADGQLAVAAEDSSNVGEGLRIGVNREFLLEALTASGRGQLVLELDGPITPLAVRVPGNAPTFSILMPTRLS